MHEVRHLRKHYRLLITGAAHATARSVCSLSQKFISEVALEWRRFARNENLPYFNIVEFIERVLEKHWVRKGRLHIKFFDAPENAPDEELAWVEFRPKLTLHVDRELWRLALDGEPRARFIVAHEIGHIVLHEHDAKHFSSDPSVQIKFAQDENSAEWQANVFASYFLVPENVMASFDHVADLIEKTWVNEPFVLSRHANACVSSIRRHTHQAGLCSACGNFSVTSDGVCRSTVCTKKS